MKVKNVSVVTVIKSEHLNNSLLTVRGTLNENPTEKELNISMQTCLTCLYKISKYERDKRG